MNKKEDMSKTEIVKEKAAREVFDWVETFCQALFVVVILFTFFFRFVTVDGSSMNDTLQHGDRLIISEIGYTPQRGDIVVVHDLEASTAGGDRLFSGPIIKRVIATEGETVLIDYENCKITVTRTDGTQIVLDEPYVKFEKNELRVPNNSYYYPNSVGHMESHVVKKGHVFVCGDNRNNSMDSRYVGDIDSRKIMGKVLIRVLPVSNIGFPD